MAGPQRKMVTVVFRDPARGQNAYDSLLHRGYPPRGINVLMSDTTRAAYFVPGGDDERRLAGNHTTEGLGIGGTVGTAVGATLAAILALGTFITVPVLGLGVVVAGPLAAAFAGGGAGAVTGGFLGALIGMGFPKANAEAYQEALRSGGVILGVVPRDRDDAEQLKMYFEEMNGESICYC